MASVRPHAGTSLQRTALLSNEGASHWKIVQCSSTCSRRWMCSDRLSRKDRVKKSLRVCGSSGGREEEGRERFSGNPGNSSVEGGLTLEEAYTILGLNVGSGYEEVLSRKSELLEECQASGDDSKQKALLVEMAYDTIFSSQLKARLSGDLQVSSSVRFADVKRPAAPKPNAFRKLQEKVNMPSVPNDLIIVSPLKRQEDIAIASGIFLTLLVWCLAQGSSPGESTVGGGDVPGFQIGLGVASVVYFEREKKRTTLTKSLTVALLGLIIGTIVGSLIESWLRVDIVPLFSLSNPASVVGSFSLIGLYLSLVFLG